MALSNPGNPGSGFYIGSSGVASFSNVGFKSNNLQAAKMALAGKNGVVKEKYNNLHKAQRALEKKKNKTPKRQWVKVDPQMFKDLDYELNPSQTATEAMIKGQNEYATKYAAKWNGEPWNGSTTGPVVKDEDYRKKVMDRTLNMAYEQREKTLYPIYTADKGVIQAKNLVQGFIPWGNGKKKKGPF